MIFIENDGALFRGPARGVPQDVWSVAEGKFVPYKLAGQPKPVEWGNVIDESEAKLMMGDSNSDGPDGRSRSFRVALCGKHPSYPERSEPFQEEQIGFDRAR